MRNAEKFCAHLFQCGGLHSQVPVLNNTIASDHVIDTAYAWLCERRKAWHANADVWALRFCWPAEKARLREALLAGRYCFEPMQRSYCQKWCSGSESSGGLVDVCYLDSVFEFHPSDHLG